MGRILIAVLLLLVTATGCGVSSQKLYLGERFGGIVVDKDNPYYEETVTLLEGRNGFAEAYNIGYGRPGAKLLSYEYQEQGYILGALSDGDDEIRFGLAMEQPPYPDVCDYVIKWTFFIYDSAANEWTYYDEDSCAALMDAVVNAQHYELAGKTFIAEVLFDTDEPTEYTVRADEVTYRITLYEPVEAAKGELLEITILPQDEPLKWGDRLPANAKKLTE